MKIKDKREREKEREREKVSENQSLIKAIWAEKDLALSFVCCGKAAQSMRKTSD